MPLVFSAITPHPPIIVPGVSSPTEFRQCQKTVTGMQALGREFSSAKPEAIVIMSPHSPSLPEGFALNTAPDIEISLLDFGVTDPDLLLHADKSLSDQIIANTQATAINNSRADHGVAVPLFYLLSQSANTTLVSLGYAQADLREHFAFGKKLAEIIGQSEKRIAFVASGDLSHRLTPDAPAGFSKHGQEFDDLIVKHLQNKDKEAILNLDPSMINAVGECGLRSIATLLGIIDQTDYQTDIISYEGPFGVGYLVANLKL
ncbi:AmmeMemoRadiSam system protein B [Patescibacteria group bacterium]